MSEQERGGGVSEEARRLFALYEGAVTDVTFNSARASLLSYISSLEADKRRLDWMQNEGADVRTPNAEVEIIFQFAPSGEAKYSVDLGSTGANGLTLRAAIDAAMEKSSPAPSTETPVVPETPLRGSGVI